MVMALVLTVSPASYNAIGVFILLAMLDFCMGVIHAAIRRRLRSRSLTDGALRKTSIVVLLCAVAIMQSVLQMGALLLDTLVVYYAVGEVLSIIEHAEQMGVPIPQWLRSRLSRFQPNGEGKTP